MEAGSLPIHSWIFENEEQELSRLLGRALLGELVEQFGIPEIESHSALFKSRIKYFFVDNKRAKQVNLSISSLKHSTPIKATLNKTSANGHAMTDLTYNQGRS